jgi:adenine-specific DNA-methyltransferase
MRQTYAGKVKLIYIDPPYNTGHDFVYDDDFAQTREEYVQDSGDYDSEGGRLVANPESNGRFHSDWCSMIYPRLLLARDLLSHDGAIFISIDDNELTNACKITDEVFGNANHVATFSVVNNLKGRNDKANYAPCHEYIVVYGKSSFSSYGIPLSADKADSFDLCDKAGNKYQLRDLRKRGNGDRREDRPNMYFPIYYSEEKNECSLEPQPSADCVAIYPKLSDGSDGRWRWGKETVRVNLGLLEPRKKRAGNWGIEYRVYLDPRLNPTSQGASEERRDKPKSIWLGPEFSTDVAQREIKDLYGGVAPFDFPKSVSLIRRVVQMSTREDDLVLDFFSGSATTAHAVMQQNAEDGGNRKFIMVQLPEVCDKDSEAYKAGYRTICDIGEERIRRAGEKIRAEVEEANRQAKIGEEPKKVPDIGFRVFRVDSSNFQDVRRQPDQLGQQQLSLYTDNLKPDRTAEDLLFQVLPKFRIPYSAKVQKREVCGKTVFDVNDGQLVACFDVDVETDTIEAIARMRPLYAVFRDASMADDATEANFEVLFKTYSPDTIRRVI